MTKQYNLLKWCKLGGKQAHHMTHWPLVLDFAALGLLMALYGPVWLGLAWLGLAVKGRQFFTDRY